MHEDWSPHTFLDDLLAGVAPTVADIHELARRRVPEGVQLEFKDARWLDKDGRPPSPGKPSDPAAKLRQYVAGFANGDGGVLIVGIGEADHRADAITPCPATIGGRALDLWAQSALTPLAAYLQPPARVHAVAHGEGAVLVVAVHRAPNIVPVAEAAQTVYYLRNHEETVMAPAYLVADLLLGRRQRPVFDLEPTPFVTPRTDDRTWANVQVHFTVTNVGLTWSKSTRAGVLGWSRETSGSRIPSELLAYVDLGETPSKCSLVHLGPAALTRTLGAPDALEPYNSQQCGFAHQFGVPVVGKHRWRGAIYILADGAPPSWFQVDVPTGTLAQAKGRPPVQSVLVHEGRVRVAVE